MEGLSWTLAAGVILTAAGSLGLAGASLRNPVEVGSSFNPMRRKRGPIENFRALHRAARRTALRSSATFVLANGLFLQAFGVGLQPDLTLQDWLLGLVAALIIALFGIRQWRTARQDVLNGSGSWVAIGPGADIDFDNTEQGNTP